MDNPRRYENLNYENLNYKNSNRKNLGYDQIAIVIPALEPTPLLLDYTQGLLSYGFAHIVVVNDGSSAAYDKIFQAVGDLINCTVLTHQENLGKGAALKTGYEHILRELPNCQGIITADSDGQHAVNDVCKVAQKILKNYNLENHNLKNQGLQNNHSLVLGSRDFSLPNIPVKSRVGNRMSTILFWTLHGIWLTDTQTGLRGFSKNLLNEMLAIKGERFEYETNVLIHCVDKKIPIEKVTIQTIYEDNNQGTHFQPIKDSISIGKALLSRLGRYMLSSGLSTFVDLAMAFMLFDLLLGVTNDEHTRITAAVILARLCSMVVNFTLNKRFVFCEKDGGKYALGKYLSLCFVNMILASQMVYFGHFALGFGEKMSKILTDTLLFLMNFQIQRIWVFAKKSS